MHIQGFPNLGKIAKNCIKIQNQHFWGKTVGHTGGGGGGGPPPPPPVPALEETLTCMFNHHS